MNRDLHALSTRTFDIVVIGGGITGACTAHDASLRGLSVALVDKGDFGAATSAASSKLLHGGIRYLQQLQLGKVRESARERAAFLRVAPHLIRWVPFLIPTTTSLGTGRLLLGAGIGAYQALTVRTAPDVREPALRPPRDFFLPKRKLLARYPLLESLEGVTGAWVIHEAHMQSSERMSLAFVMSAAARGAVVANYAEVTRVLRDNARVSGVEVTDRLTGGSVEVRARLVINASGPWIGRINAPLGAAHLERDITAFSKGVHIVTRQLFEDAAVAVATRHRSQAVIQRGGRHFFVIPWRGHSLIGTTNVPFVGPPDHVEAGRADVDAFLEDVGDALPGARLSRADVRFAFAGLYPLTADVIQPDVFQGTGRYQLVDHARQGVDNFVSVLGAKFTTARGLAERTVNLAIRKLGVPDPGCHSAVTPVAGGGIEDIERFRRDTVRRFQDLVPADVVEHLVTHYGSHAEAVIATAQAWPRGLDRLTPAQPVVEAEVRYGVSEEMALTLADVVFRRTGLGTIGHPGRPCLDRCAAILAQMLQWSADRTAAEIDGVERRFTTA